MDYTENNKELPKYIRTNVMIFDYMGRIHSEDETIDLWEMSVLTYNNNYNLLIPVAKKCIADLGKLNEGKKSRSATLDANAMAGRILGSALDIKKLYNSVLDAIIFINKHKTT